MSASLLRFFVVLLVVTTAARAQDPAQSVLTDGMDQAIQEAESGMGGDWNITAGASGTYVFGGEIGGADGEIDVAITRLSLQAAGPGWFGSRISGGAGYEHRFYDFDFDSVEPFFGTAGDQTIEFHSIGANVNFIQGFSKHWGAFVNAGFNASSEVGADLGDGITWRVFTGVGYRASEDFSIGLGVGFLGRLEEDLLIIPTIQMRWRFAEEWLFRIQGQGLGFEWSPLDDWTFILDARFNSRRYRLNDGTVTNSGIFEDRRIPVSLIARHQIDETWQVDATVGVDVFREFRVEDKNGNNGREYSPDTSFFIGLGLRATF